jgi:hypothetical protein
MPVLIGQMLTFDEVGDDAELQSSQDSGEVDEHADELP